MINKIINIIKLGEKNKKKIIIVKKTNINFIKFILKMNLIKFFLKTKNKIVLKLNLMANNKLIFKIKNIKKNSNNKIIKYKTIKKIYNKNKILIISSNKGLKNNFECLHNNTGGEILLCLWN